MEIGKQRFHSFPQLAQGAAVFTGSGNLKGTRRMSYELQTTRLKADSVIRLTSVLIDHSI